MTLPGAETMNGGIIGLDCFRRERCLSGTPLVLLSSRELPDAPLAPPDSPSSSGMWAGLWGSNGGAGSVACDGVSQGCVWTGGPTRDEGAIYASHGGYGAIGLESRTSGLKVASSLFDLGLEYRVGGESQ